MDCNICLNIGCKFCEGNEREEENFITRKKLDFALETLQWNRDNAHKFDAMTLKMASEVAIQTIGGMR